MPAELPAAVHETLQGRPVVENEHGPEILDAHTQAQTELAHLHIGPALVAGALDDTVAAAEAGEDNVDVGIAEDGVARGRCDLGPGLGTYLVERVQGFLLHVDDRPAFILRAVALARGASAEQDHQGREG